MYQVGVALNPEIDDPEFEDRTHAEIYAIGRSVGEADIFAVWDKADGELLCLVYKSRVFE